MTAKAERGVQRMDAKLMEHLRGHQTGRYIRDTDWLGALFTATKNPYVQRHNSSYYFPPAYAWGKRVFIKTSEAWKGPCDGKGSPPTAERRAAAAQIGTALWRGMTLMEGEQC